MNRLKGFSEFISEEFTKVVSRSSSSGKTKHIDTIWDEPTSDKSHSSSVLLRKKLRDEETDDIISQMNIDPKLMYRFGGNRQAGAVAINNKRFLDEMSKKGDLMCEYCGSGPLKNYPFGKFKHKDGATVDHKEPMSRGGNKFDFKNMAVCCNKCNERKGDKSYDDWIYLINSSSPHSASRSSR